MPGRELLKKARRVVIKVGTALLTGGTAHLDRRYIVRLTGAVGRLLAQGREAAIVTSGAIGAGCGLLGYAKRPATLPERQACAAAGQVELMKVYAQAFRRLRPPRTVGQLLLTRDGLEQRNRYLNARNTLESLFASGAVPIVNENDTVAVDEIRFGDNDTLSALVAVAADAGALVILTDVPGLMEAPPREKPDAKLLSCVTQVTPEIEALARPSASGQGAGGMITKLEAAKLACASGLSVVLVGGHRPEVLEEVFDGREAGTFFPPRGDRIAARKSWLALTPRPQGVVRVDAGAREALVKRHKSLLPSGIIGLQGAFDSGDVVEVAGPDGQAFARGLSNYSSAEIGKIRGKRTAQIARELGQVLFAEVIHCDNLVIL